MTLITTIALACTVLASVPVLVARKRVLLNPALFVFASVAWGVTAKAVYMDLFRSEPYPIVHDKIYVGAASADQLQIGAWMALTAVAAYVAGYFLIGARVLPVTAREEGSTPISQYTRVAIVGLWVLCVAAFLAYLYSSATSLLSGPFSDKRFQIRAIGAASRFQYQPYYFFKVAMLSAPLAYAVAYLLSRTEGRGDTRFFKGAFAAVFVFALSLAHFASLRLAVTLILVQIALLLYALRVRRLVAFMSVFVLLTAISFGVLTFHRAAPEMQGRESRALANRSDAGAPPPEPAKRSAPSRPETEPEAQHRGDRLPPANAPLAAHQPEASPAERDVSRPQEPGLVDRFARLVEGPIEGRYFLDFTKLGHIANHFPRVQPYLLGDTLVGVVVPSETLPGTRGPQGLTLDRYLGERVFEEPGNSVPAGYAAELYIGAGWRGLLVGFLLLGAFHRLLFNLITSANVPGFVTACLVVLIPNTTLILLNSGILPAVSRSVLGVGLLTLLCIPDLGARYRAEQSLNSRRNLSR